MESGGVGVSGEGGSANTPEGIEERGSSMGWAKRIVSVFLGGVGSRGSRGKGAPRGRRVALEALEDRRLLSVDYGLTPVDTGGVTWWSSPVVFGDAIYFAANDAEHGWELWKMDANEDVSLVSDIRSGSESSSPTELTVLGDRLYFQADDGIHSRELWSIDSFGSVSLVADLYTGAEQRSGPRDLTLYGGEVFFVAQYGDPGVGLWKIDASGSVTLVNDYSEAVSWLDSNLTVAVGALHYKDPDGDYWRMDSAGTEPDLRHVADPEVICFNESFFKVEDGGMGTGHFVPASLWEIDESGSSHLVTSFDRAGLPSGGIFEQSAGAVHVSSDAIYVAMWEEDSLGMAYHESLWSVDSAGISGMVLDYGVPDVYDDGISTSFWGDWMFFDDRYGALHASGPDGYVTIEGGDSISVPRNLVRFGNYVYFSTCLRASQWGSWDWQIWKFDAPAVDFGDAPDNYGTIYEKEFVNTSGMSFFETFDSLRVSDVCSTIYSGSHALRVSP